MAFKKKRKSVESYEDIESLFRDLRNRTVEGLLSHQSDILRRYETDAFDEPNVAIELPTGSGKTLVGLLISEFRRLTKGERVLFLCPTKQLVLQVCQQAERKYGIKATPFVGQIRDYPPDDKLRYQTAKTIAVAPYSALFNTNPFFDSPEHIVLDDAHASENYIASTWSVNVARTKYENTYLGLLDILEPAIPPVHLQRFKAPERDERSVKWIEKVSSHDLLGLGMKVSAFLDENTADNDLRYSWSMISGHLEACHIYVSYDSILLRPLIPPSLTHAPFAAATQRVFMSATLGMGGDLERTTGIRSFSRLPMPVGWDKQGIGRRFFVFPELSLSDEEIDGTLKAMVDTAGRALVLVPSDRQVERFRTLFSNATIYLARDIESSKDEFVLTPNGVAILANRYDGIDLLGDECRLLIIEGLPKAGNLQELFLMSRMAAGVLFNDRLRTRIIQAVGRCTRSATDYAAVCVIGEDFCDWFVMTEKRALFHPELQGELAFGIDQAQGMSSSSLLENLQIFLSHGDAWDEVDSDIREYRAEARQKAMPGQDALFETASLEVDYQYAMWSQDYQRALEKAQEVASILSGDHLKGIRGFWLYLSGAAAELARAQLKDSAYATKASDLYRRAVACVPAVGWLQVLARSVGVPEVKLPSDLDPLLESNVERVEMLFDSRSYTSPRRFEKDVKEILAGLDSDNDSAAFEESHRRLGELLGFESSNSDGDAAPDPWWISNGDLCLVSEDKNDSAPANPVSVKHTRQAASHPKWIREHVRLNDNAKIFTVLITPATKVHREVPTYADDVAWWQIQAFRTWARSAINTMREARTTFTGPGNLAWRRSVYQLLKERKFDPKSIVATATRVKLRDVPPE